MVEQQIQRGAVGSGARCRTVPARSSMALLRDAAARGAGAGGASTAVVDADDGLLAGLAGAVLPSGAGAGAGAGAGTGASAAFRSPAANRSINAFFFLASASVPSSTARSTHRAIRAGGRE